MKKNSKVLLTGIAIVVPLGLAFALLCWYDPWKIGPKHAEGGELYQQVFKAYQDGEYAAAAALVGANFAVLLREPEGCELMISVFAETKEMPQLEAISRSCMAQNRADGISQEGLAHALSSQGKIEAGIAELQREHEIKPENPRIALALAHLLTMMARDEEAGKLFLQVIAREESWSMWCAQALKQKSLLANKDFVRDLTAIVVKKPRIFAQLEKTLQEAAQELQLTQAVQDLEQRQQKAASDAAAK
jgi:tetratricopeptide (TPR) repeat protein